MTENETTFKIIASAIDVHRILGPGLLENSYKKCLQHQLALDGFNVATEVKIPLVYKGLQLDSGFRMDLLVDNAIVVEVKSVAELQDIHLAQTLTYLRTAKYHLGLIINFNVPVLKKGIKRVINGY